MDRFETEFLAIDENVGSFMRTLFSMGAVEHQSPITLNAKFVKTSVEITHYARDVTFQMAEVAVPCALSEKVCVAWIASCPSQPRHDRPGIPGMRKHSNRHIDSPGNGRLAFYVVTVRRSVVRA